ncbi:MAG: hypothetical protein ACQCN4_13185 [Candidatus Bathyarchaeia archaeon]
MMLKFKRTLLLLSIIIFLFSSVYTVQAADVSVQQDGAVIAQDVIGVDLTKYAANSEYKQDLYLGALPQENIRCTLEAQGSKLDLYYTFVDGKLEKIRVLEAQGNLQMQKRLC